MQWRRFALAVIAAVGCSSTSSPTTPPANTDTGSIEDTSDQDTAEEVADATPPGPCGVKVGDTLCDVNLEGYFRDGETIGLGTAGERGTFKLSEILARGTQKYALIWNSAYW